MYYLFDRYMNWDVIWHGYTWHMTGLNFLQVPDVTVYDIQPTTSRSFILPSQCIMISGCPSRMFEHVCVYPPCTSHCFLSPSHCIRGTASLRALTQAVAGQSRMVSDLSRHGPGHTAQFRVILRVMLACISFWLEPTVHWSHNKENWQPNSEGPEKGYIISSFKFNSSASPTRTHWHGGVLDLQVGLSWEIKSLLRAPHFGPTSTRTASGIPTTWMKTYILVQHDTSWY